MKLILFISFVFSPLVLAEELRFPTERPTKIRAARTVSEGHYIFESEFVNYSENVDEETQGVKLMQLLLRYGLTSKLEIQAKHTPFNKLRQKTTDRWETETGFSDTELGLKYNLQGNESGSLAVSLQPYAVLPTSSPDIGDDRLQGGLSIPMKYKNFGFMLEANTVRENLSWQTNYIGALSFSHSLFLESLNGTIEIYHEEGLNDQSSNITTLDLALQYKVYEHVKLDIGTFIGLSPAADDAQVFTGGSFLF